MKIEEIESSEAAVKGFLDDIQEPLQAKTYVPKAVRRVYRKGTPQGGGQAGAFCR